MHGSLASLAALGLTLLSGCELVLSPDSVAPPGSADACAPQDCLAQARRCGPADDGCGKSLDCGACTGTERCVDGSCLDCAPDCRTRKCGSDGCGGSCGNCPAGKVCDDRAGACIGCLADSDCLASPLGPHCHPALRECVQCVTSFDCDSAGQVPCDDLTHSCSQVGCHGEGDCAAPTPHCDTSSRVCVACRDEPDCAAPTPHCELSSHACVGCRDDLDCTALAPHCDSASRACLFCRDDADCPTATHRCQAPQSCLQCLSGADCVSSTPLCSPAGACVECLTGGDCASTICGPDGRCVTTTPKGDTCADPLPLSFVSSVATAGGSTAGYADDQTCSCGGSGSPDLVFHFTLTEAHDVEVVAWPGSFSYRPLLSVRTACDSGELSCAYSPGAGVPAATTLPNLGSGDYFIWLDGFYASSGSYTLGVVTRPPSSPMPDTCTGARPLLFDSQGQAFATSSTVGAKSDAVGSCGGKSSPDLAFSVTTSSSRALDVTVFSLEAPGVYQPVVYLRDACVSPNELACDDGSLLSDQAKIAIDNLPAGKFYLWVDGISGGSGRFALWASLSAPR